jgi:hypothetical protein
MCGIYIVNVGANTNHCSRARSPIFHDGTWRYVSFCADPDNEPHCTECPEEMLPFTNPNLHNLVTHNDPDWNRLTYGDDCSAPRAAALGGVEEGDILLLWGVLWCNHGNTWNDFAVPLWKNWYLLGALRVDEVVKGGQRPDEISPRKRHRAQQNIHWAHGAMLPRERIFISVRQFSRRFEHAADLQVDNQANGLIYEAFRAADGRQLLFNASPRWRSSLRACREMWDLSDAAHFERAQLVRDAIQRVNQGFDLLQDIAH